MANDAIAPMILSINAKGVSVPGYAAFTDYIVVASSSGDDTVKNAYITLTIEATRNLYLFLGFVICGLCVA